MQDQNQMVAYIVQLRTSGYPDEIIRQQLIIAGWPAEMINAAMGGTSPLPPSMFEQPPARRGIAKIILIVGGIVILFLVIAGVVYSQTAGKKDAENMPTTSDTKNPSGEGTPFQSVLDQYCQTLATKNGLVEAQDEEVTGYVITERFPEATGGSPYLLRLKRVDHAAAATVDCESVTAGQMGLSNDLLFIEENDEWTFVDEVQNHAGTAFSCSVIEKYAVSTELVKECAKTQGGAAEPR